MSSDYYASSPNDKLVSIIVPAFNAEKYIDQCIQSLVDQSYKELEILILNDGSTDGTSEKLALWEVRDNRVRVMSRQNKGLVVTLNELIAESRGRFIARMDADDYCHLERITKQVAALGGEMALVGSNCLVVDDESNIVGRFRYEKKHNRISVDGFFRAQFCHPAVMFDRQKISRGDLYYDPKYRHAEDLELWFRLLKTHLCCNLSENLLYVRRGHATNVSTIHAHEQFETTFKIVELYAGFPIRHIDILNLRQRDDLKGFAKSGFRVGFALVRKSTNNGVMFFRKWTLILLVSITRKAVNFLHVRIK